MEIPRLGVSVILVEGVKPRDLRLAVGHIPGTAFPDELGNVGLAGHRDTFFRELKGIRRGDLIVVTTIRESTQYSVEWTHIVKPRNVEVLEASPEPVADVSYNQ
jgi:sortase A